MIKKLTIHGTLLLVTTHLLLWCVFVLFDSSLPKFLPDSNINIYGFTIWLSVTVLIIWQLSRINRLQPGISFLQLVWSGTVSTLLSEFIFQLFRTFTFQANLSVHLYYLWASALLAAGVGLFTSLFIALIIWKKQRRAVMEQ